MAHIKKLSAFRQLSLNNCEPVASEKRKHFLRKQFSEDFPDIKISFGTKTRDRPPNRPIKIAWDDCEELPLQEDSVIVKKCQENRRPLSKFTRHNSLEKESILYSKQDLEERLREAFKKQEDERKNLNIFISSHNQKDEEVESILDQDCESNLSIPKIIPPLLTAEATASERNIFQLRTARETPPPKSVLVVPLVESPTPPSENKPIDVIIRPSTAATKRQQFQKRTNSAFNVSLDMKRPPLIRSSSAPSKPEKSKCKFIANKRKLKSSSKRKKKIDDELAEIGEDIGPIQKIGAEVVTMVSLVSPSASDGEEEPPPSTQPDNKVKSNLIKTRNKEEKPNKTVSFQQSSIHAIRSFSASFPGRRHSIVNPVKLTKMSNPPTATQQEKRATTGHLNSADEDERGPKRRHRQNSIDKEDTTPINQSTKIKINIKSKSIDSGNTLESPKKDEKSTDDDQENIAVDVDGKIVRFGTTKEKECWEMYKKMIDRGINVTYDAILRGMLTPTEYRMRKKEVIDDVEDSGGEENSNSSTTAITEIK